LTKNPKVINKVRLKALFRKEMPDLEEHCKQTKEQYGIEGRDIHSWMDEPCKIFGGSHRKVRHDVTGIKDAYRIFSTKYPREDIERIMTAHILLDANYEPKNTVIRTVQVRTNLIEEPEDKELQKRLKREMMLSKIKTPRIKDYINIAYGNAETGSFYGVYNALSNWEKFIVSRENHNSATNIDSYTLSLRKLKPKTAFNYLYYLGSYFRHYNQTDLSSKVADRKKEFVKRFKKDITPIHPNDVEALYNAAKPKVKLTIRLLLLEKRKICEIEKITYVGKDIEGKSQFSLDNKIIPINDITVKLAEDLLERNLLRGDKRLLSAGQKPMTDNIRELAKKIGLPYIVNSKDLRKFADTQHPDIILKILGDKKE